LGRIGALIPHPGIAEVNAPVRMMVMNERPTTVIVGPKPPVRIPPIFAIPLARNDFLFSAPYPSVLGLFSFVEVEA